MNIRFGKPRSWVDYYDEKLGFANYVWFATNKSLWDISEETKKELERMYFSGIHWMYYHTGGFVNE